MSIASFDESLSSRLISTVIRGVFRADFEGPGCLCVRLQYIITSRHINLFRKRILSKGGEANTLTANSGNIYLRVDQTFDVQYPSAPSADHCFQTHQRARMIFLGRLNTRMDARRQGCSPELGSPCHFEVVAALWDLSMSHLGTFDEGSPL